MGLFYKDNEIKLKNIELQERVQILENENEKLHKINEQLESENKKFHEKYVDGVKKCKTCGYALSLEYRVCPYCGEKVTKEISILNGKSPTNLFVVKEEEEDFGCIITAYKGFEKHLVIPSIINGIPVIGIGEKTFSGCNELEEVWFEEGCKYIGVNAFADCKNLRKIHLPCTLKRIKDWAFSSDDELEEIILPSNVEALGCNVFWLCKNLKRVVLSNKIKYISKRAFEFTGIEEIDIPESVKIIGESAFSCTKLREIYLPLGLQRIEKDAFGMCDSLRKVVMHSNIQFIEGPIFRDLHRARGLKNLEIYCSAGSVAQKYAREYELNCVQIPEVENM